MNTPLRGVRTALMAWLVLALAACSVIPPKEDAPDLSRVVIVDVVAASELISAQIPVLDVRTPEEWAQGHLAVAHLTPLDQLPKVLAPLDLEYQDPVLIYCRSGNRALKAGNWMADAGYTHVHVFRPGGYEQLRTAGLPVVVPTP